MEISFSPTVISYFCVPYIQAGLLFVLVCSVGARPSPPDSSQSVVVQSAAGAPPPPANMLAQAAAVMAEPSVGVAHVPAQIGTAISKTVHYAETPVVSGYMSTLLKPELSALDTPLKYNLNRYFRPVKTIIPKLMAMEPKMNVEMPMVAALKEVEMHPPILPEIRVANPIYYSPMITSLVR